MNLSSNRIFRMPLSTTDKIINIEATLQVVLMEKIRFLREDLCPSPINNGCVVTFYFFYYKESRESRDMHMQNETNR